MAALTYFIATSHVAKRLSFEELESFVLDLLREQHLYLPAAIFVGEARNELRGNAYDVTSKTNDIFRASECIIPNAPDAMLHLTKKMAEGKVLYADTFWFFGDDERAFGEALRRIPFTEKDCCICFPYLNQNLSDCGWYGAAIYVLRHPFFIDFMDVFDITALPLIHYNVSHFFTLSSLVGGGFPDKVYNPLRPILERYFGPELDMKQTWE